jgi:hypothetical protein
LAYPAGGEPGWEPAPFVVVGTWAWAFPEPEREPLPFVVVCGVMGEDVGLGCGERDFGELSPVKVMLCIFLEGGW